MSGVKLGKSRSMALASQGVPIRSVTEAGADIVPSRRACRAKARSRSRRASRRRSATRESTSAFSIGVMARTTRSGTGFFQAAVNGYGDSARRRAA